MFFVSRSLSAAFTPQGSTGEQLWYPAESPQSCGGKSSSAGDGASAHQPAWPPPHAGTCCHAACHCVPGALPSCCPAGAASGGAVCARAPLPPAPRLPQPPAPAAPRGAAPWWGFLTDRKFGRCCICSVRALAEHSISIGMACDMEPNNSWKSVTSM